MASKKFAIIGAACAIVVCAFAARIAWVNINAQDVVEETSAINEQVDLAGCFAEDIDENTDGLSVELTSAEIMSAQEYVDRYAQDDINLLEEDLTYCTVDEDNVNNNSVLVLGLTFSNTNNEIGYFPAISWRVISHSAQDICIMPDWDIWRYVDQSAAEETCFKVRTGTSVTTYIPFCAQAPTGFLQSFLNVERRTLDSDTYSLVLTNSPIRKTIKFEA
jgi:hypothetical protein